MEGPKKWCRLCGDAIEGKNFKEINRVVKESLIVLLLKLNIDDNAQHVICRSCFTKLLAALTFKSICLHNDNTIVPYVDVENPRPVDLKDIYLKKMGKKQENNTLDDLQICRLCMQPVGNGYVSLQEVPVKIIQTYIPEMEFKMTANPVVCVKCYNSLLTHSLFLRNCFNVEETMFKDNDMESVMISTDENIKSEEIDVKSEEASDEKEEMFIKPQFFDKSEGIDDQSNTSSHSLVGETGGGMITKDNLEQAWNPVETQMHIFEKFQLETEEHKDTLKLHQISHKNPSDVQMYKCGKCKFETRHEGHLKRHNFETKDRLCPKKYLSLHKGSSEAQRYKCDTCKYETNRKGNLNIHKLIHQNPSEVQKFKCDKCKYETNRKGDLTKHKLIHKNPWEVQMYECEECTYETKFKSHLKQHLLTHKDPSEVQMYKCDRCAFETKYKQYLSTHKFIHLNPLEVQRYKCDKCKYETKYKDSLKIHELCHKYPLEVQMYKDDKMQT